MLDATIGGFLDTVTEREFDPVIIALLAARGFHDIHFIHGSFEFGKDILAKRADPETGVVHQYAIQSKAGDIGMPEWRAVRPQLEESEYNTLGHPSFDTTLPRVAVLLTTGRLKGAAPIDSKQFAETAKRRGLARIEFWDREDLIGWLTSQPDIALLSSDTRHELQRLLVNVRADSIDEPMLERYSRRWIGSDVSGVEGAVIINALRERGRLDLAAMCAAHMFRGSLLGSRPQDAESARRLFCAIGLLLLNAVEPFLEEPAEFVRADPHPASLVSYAVAAVRTTELLALAALLQDGDDGSRLTRAVTLLCARHPGVARPVSDQFAVSLLPITVVLFRANPGATADYLRDVSRWTLDRHDPAQAGLGLGSIDESPRAVTHRLMGGWLESTTVSRSMSSYVLTVLLDLCLATGDDDLFSALREDAEALRIGPCLTTVGKRPEDFRRASGPVKPVPHIEYDADGGATPPRDAPSGWDPADTLLLTASCRSRHYAASLTALLNRQSV